MDAHQDTKQQHESVAADAVPASEVKRDASTDIYIDPIMERAIMRKFDWFVLPQFIIIIILVRKTSQSQPLPKLLTSHRPILIARTLVSLLPGPHSETKLN
jgi:hypothetical protein